MRTTKGGTVLAVCLVVWALICVWQAMEHYRVRRTARKALIGRARDISNSLGVVIRSQSRFGMIRYGRLQAALDELAKSSELQAVALLNAEGERVASAGAPSDLGVEELVRKGAIHWGAKSAVFVNLVDLGLTGRDGQTTRTATIVLPPEGSETPRGGPPPPPGEEGGSPPPPGTPPNSDLRPEGEGPPFMPPPLPPPDDGTSTRTWREAIRDGLRRRRPPPNWGRPPWMSEERYHELLQERGLHGFILEMSTASYRGESARDLRLRIGLSVLALAALLGIAFGWNNMRRANVLQLRLLRAGEMNRHLKEMNVAAAGLAHETRNPLNIVRGMAQMISQNGAAAEEDRRAAREIVEEVDRVTVRLNEFINYSRPPEPRPARVNLRAVAREVERALGSDLADKSIRFEISGPDVAVEADESLLRQILFNLLMNAIEAVPQGGRIELMLESVGRDEAALEVRDNGPGVAAGHEKDIFQPYYTTRKEGTGLGLAVVRQIALAHQWEVEYVRGEDGITRFRVSGMKVVGER